MSTDATIHDRYPSRVADRPELLDREDPVVAATAKDPSAGPLTAEQVDAFDRDGFLFLEDVFSPEEVAGYLTELERLSADADLKRQERVITERGSDEVRSIFEVHRVSPAFDAMSKDARLADVTRQLLGGDVTLHQTRVNSKPGFRGKEFWWHSDFETWHCEDGMPAMRAISASIALTDNTEHNGPLMVMPGSHRRYVTCVGETPEDHYRSSLQVQEVGVPDAGSLRALADEFGIVAPKGRAGSVVFFDCNMMHGSNGNITPYPRSNAFFVYNHVDNALEDPFAAATPRPPHVAHREVTPLPRS